jgi:hypothetical protein
MLNVGLRRSDQQEQRHAFKHPGDHGSGRARQTHSSIASTPLPGSHTSFSESRNSLDKLAAQPVAAHTPDARATFAALQTRRRCQTERGQIRLSRPARV